MKNVKFALTTLVFALAVTGAVVAKTNEKKRALSTTSYYRNAANSAWITLTSSTAAFDAQGTSTQAQLIDETGAGIPIYIQQNTNNPALFHQP